MGKAKLIGLDLPNGRTYIGRSEQTPGEHTIILNDYISLETSKVWQNIAKLYSNSDYPKIKDEALRVDWGDGLAMRIGPQID